MRWLLNTRNKTGAVPFDGSGVMRGFGGAGVARCGLGGGIGGDVRGFSAGCDPVALGAGGGIGGRAAGRAAAYPALPPPPAIGPLALPPAACCGPDGDDGGAAPAL